MADHKIIFTENLHWIEEEKCTNYTLPCAYATFIVCISDPTYTNLGSYCIELLQFDPLSSSKFGPSENLCKTDMNLIQDRYTTTTPPAPPKPQTAIWKHSMLDNTWL